MRGSCRGCPERRPRAMICFGERSGKARHGLREIAPFERHRNGGDLPVAGRRVLAARHFLRRAVEGGGQRGGLAVEAESARRPGRCGKPERQHVGQVERALREARRGRRRLPRRLLRYGRTCWRRRHRNAPHRRRRRCRRNPERTGMRGALLQFWPLVAERLARHRIWQAGWQFAKRQAAVLPRKCCRRQCAAVRMAFSNRRRGWTATCGDAGSRFPSWRCRRTPPSGRARLAVRGPGDHRRVGEFGSRRGPESCP